MTLLAIYVLVVQQLVNCTFTKLDFLLFRLWFHPSQPDQLAHSHPLCSLHASVQLLPCLNCLTGTVYRTAELCAATNYCPALPGVSTGWLSALQKLKEAPSHPQRHGQAWTSCCAFTLWHMHVCVSWIGLQVVFFLLIKKEIRLSRHPRTDLHHSNSSVYLQFHSQWDHTATPPNCLFRHEEGELNRLLSLLIQQKPVSLVHFCFQHQTNKLVVWVLSDSETTLYLLLRRITHFFFQSDAWVSRQLSGRIKALS